MNPEPLDQSEAPRVRGASLGRVLERTRKIKLAVRRAATRITRATAVLKRGKDANSAARPVERAITQYEGVQEEVAQAAHDLTQVNADLAVEVAERADIESELADAKADLAEMKVDLATAHDDLSESKSSEDEALHRSLHDPLTGLPNRALFDESLEHGLTQARRHGWGLAVLFIDIDDFKNINDLYGHHVGDEVLLMVADRLRSFVRAEDMISRRGGDEFVCMLIEVERETEVAGLARSMCGRIGEEFESGGTTLLVGCSIGIAMYPADGESAAILLRNADAAMYKAKEADDKVALFSSEPSSAG